MKKKLRGVYPVGLHVYADIFKDDVKLSYGYGDVNRTGAYKIKIRAPHETGYYKINVYSSNISKSKYSRKLISYSGTVYVKPTGSDGDGWIDAMREELEQISTRRTLIMMGIGIHKTQILLIQLYRHLKKRQDLKPCLQLWGY